MPHNFLDLANIPSYSFFRFPGELRAGAGVGVRALFQYTWKTHLLFPVYQIAGPRGWDMNEGAEPS